VKHHHLSLAGFFLPLAAAGVVWAEVLHEHGGDRVLGLLAAVFVLAWPVLAMTIWSGPSLLIALFTSPSQRAARRKRLKDAGYARSAPIRAWVRRAVFRGDRYRCVYCHKKFRRGIGLEADHYRPYAAGGRSDVFNLFALCKYHNDVKGYYWVSERTGAVSYKPYMVAPDPVMAAAIMRAEYWHARNPVRWLRVAWALAW
jgi:HNH endonuclease